MCFLILFKLRFSFKVLKLFDKAGFEKIKIRSKNIFLDHTHILFNKYNLSTDK